VLPPDLSGPKRAIYATSDAVSYALATFRDEISRYFCMYQPDLKTMMRVLDKAQLLEHATAIGMDTPETWLPASREEAQRIVRRIGGAILVKPRSQLCVRTYTKGAVAGPDVKAVLAEYDHIVSAGASCSEFARRYPDTMLPMLQRYHAEAVESIYSLSSFRDISGKHIAMLGAYKVLQRPRRLGIGLCFEQAALDPCIAQSVCQLCERIGYYGAFEVEFIRSEGRNLLIDFNARFFNQMAFGTCPGLYTQQRLETKIWLHA
jgi:predicted ATP-grasp superfamily ATP-dependent carboligase